MTSLRIRGLTKRFGSDTVVRGIDLDVDDGELLVIVGPSGCGKTTVLRMIAGLEQPTDGAILVDGRPITNVHRGQRPIGMMFQDAALYPHLTVRENIGFPLQVAGERRSVIRREVIAMAEFLGIRSLLSRRPTQLSGGQRQRVAMARALIRRPDLLLMDEPMSNLDAKLRVELRAAISHIQRELGITTVFVTHDQTEAMSLGHRIAVMRHGDVVQVEDPRAVYDAPVDAFVATFVGSPAMNVFVGRLTTSGAVPTVRIGSFEIDLSAERWSHLLPAGDRDVAVGVRPQAVRFADVGLIADVIGIEPVADRRFVTATVPFRGVSIVPSGLLVHDGPIPVVVDAGPCDDVGERPWRASHLVVAPEDVHLFELDSGRSLLADRDPARQLAPATAATT